MLKARAATDEAELSEKEIWQAVIRTICRLKDMKHEFSHLILKPEILSHKNQRAQRFRSASMDSGYSQRAKEGCLEIKVYEIFGFKDQSGPFDTTDPYVKISCGSQIMRTKTKFNVGGTTSFDETLVIENFMQGGEDFKDGPKITVSFSFLLSLFHLLLPP